MCAELRRDGVTGVSAPLVTAHMSGGVDEIDLASNQFIRSIPLGPGTSPHDVDISPDGRIAHVANFDAGTVSVVDMATSTIVATVPVGGKLQSVVFAADGRRSYGVRRGQPVLIDENGQVNGDEYLGKDQKDHAHGMFAQDVPDGAKIDERMEQKQYR